MPYVAVPVRLPGPANHRQWVLAIVGGIALGLGFLIVLALLLFHW